MITVHCSKWDCINWGKDGCDEERIGLSRPDIWPPPEDWECANYESRSSEDTYWRRRDETREDVLEYMLEKAECEHVTNNRRFREPGGLSCDLCKRHLPEIKIWFRGREILATCQVCGPLVGDRLRYLPESDSFQNRMNGTPRHILFKSGFVSPTLSGAARHLGAAPGDYVIRAIPAQVEW